jgi:hypothetical protein
MSSSLRDEAKIVKFLADSNQFMHRMEPERGFRVNDYVSCDSQGRFISQRISRTIADKLKGISLRRLLTGRFGMVGRSPAMLAMVEQIEVVVKAQ